MSFVFLPPLLAQSPSAPPLSPETSALAQGWSLLARGDAAGAAAFADPLIGQFPRSPAVASLAVAAHIRRAGGMAGLDAYERWLAGRQVEDGYVLRQVARALLEEAVSDMAEAVARVEALKALAQDGDVNAAETLHRRANAGNFAEARALASVHDPQAINILMAELASGSGNTADHIAALVDSGSPLAVAPLMAILGDATRDSALRAAAADGLGKLGAREAIPTLTPLLNDPSFPLKIAAASSLYRLGDSGGLTLLQTWENSDIAGLRVQAAKVLAASPDAGWMRVVRDLTTDVEPTNALEAATLIAPYDLELARATFERLLAHENPAVRQAAGRAYVGKVAGDFATLRRFLRPGNNLARVSAADRILQLTR